MRVPIGTEHLYTIVNFCGSVAASSYESDDEDDTENENHRSSNLMVLLQIGRMIAVLIGRCYGIIKRYRLNKKCQSGQYHPQSLNDGHAYDPDEYAYHPDDAERYGNEFDIYRDYRENE